jgi:hypothetical protein
MNEDETSRFIEADDDLPEPGPEHADTLYRDKYDKVWHCLYIEEAGWAWQPVE